MICRAQWKTVGDTRVNVLDEILVFTKLIFQ